MTELNAGRKTAGVDGTSWSRLGRRPSMADWLQHGAARGAPPGQAGVCARRATGAAARSESP